MDRRKPKDSPANLRREATTLEKRARQEQETSLHHAREAQRLRAEAARLRRRAFEQQAGTKAEG